MSRGHGRSRSWLVSAQTDRKRLERAAGLVVTASRVGPGDRAADADAHVLPGKLAASRVGDALGKANNASSSIPGINATTCPLVATNAGVASARSAEASAASARWKVEPRPAVAPLRGFGSASTATVPARPNGSSRR